MNDNPHNKSILCPRCGYDLRGITQTWNEKGACPLTGKCSECGLDFDWGLLFTESDHSWFFENSIPNHQVRRFIRTILMTYRPWRFWLEIKMTDRINFKRLVILPAILLGALFVFRLIGVCWSYQAEIGFAFPDNFTDLLEWVNWFVTDWIRGNLRFWNAQIRQDFNWATGVPFSWTVMMVLSFSLLPVSIRRAKVTRRNLWRVGIYSFIPIVPYLLIWATLDILFIAWKETAGSILFDLRSASEIGLQVVTLFGWFIWQIICWFFACRRYLKLPHAFGIAFLLTILSGLAAGTVSMFVQKLLG